MGVCHNAIPFAGTSGRRLPVEREVARPLAPLAAAAQALPSDTLPASPKIAEARVQRTPEQQAEQDGLATLAVLCLAGDAVAWQQMVSSQYKRIYAICYRFTGDSSEAEDVTQDAFLKIYRNLATFDPAKGAFATWMTTLTRNLLVDNYRRAKQDRLTDSIDVSQSNEEDGPTLSDRLADTRPNQERHYAGLELKATIQAALAKLSPDLREAVILRDLEDMDYKEIALVLKIPEGTVKSRISRGRGELARLLQRMEGQVM